MAESNLPRPIPLADPSRHLPLTALESGLRALPALPADTEHLTLIWPALKETFLRWLHPTNFNEQSGQRVRLSALMASGRSARDEISA